MSDHFSILLTPQLPSCSHFSPVSCWAATPTCTISRSSSGPSDGWAATTAASPHRRRSKQVLCVCVCVLVGSVIIAPRSFENWLRCLCLLFTRVAVLVYVWFFVLFFLYVCTWWYLWLARWAAASPPRAAASPPRCDYLNTALFSSNTFLTSKYAHRCHPISDRTAHVPGHADGLHRNEAGGGDDHAAIPTDYSGWVCGSIQARAHTRHRWPHGHAGAARVIGATFWNPTLFFSNRIKRYLLRNAAAALLLSSRQNPLRFVPVIWTRLLLINTRFSTRTQCRLSLTPRVMPWKGVCPQSRTFFVDDILKWRTRSKRVHSFSHVHTSHSSVTGSGGFCYLLGLSWENGNHVDERLLAFYILLICFWFILN